MFSSDFFFFFSVESQAKKHLLPAVLDYMFFPVLSYCEKLPWAGFPCLCILVSVVLCLTTCPSSAQSPAPAGGPQQGFYIILVFQPHEIPVITHKMGKRKKKVIMSSALVMFAMSSSCGSFHSQQWDAKASFQFVSH